MLRFTTWLLIAACLAGRAAAAPPLADYGKLAAVEQMQLSPSGALIAYVQVDGDERKLVVREAEGKILQVVGTGKLKLREVYWRGDRHVVFVTSRTEQVDSAALVSKLELAHTAALNVQTGAIRVIFGADRGMLQATFGDYGGMEVGSKSFGFFGGIELDRGGNGFSNFDTGKGALTHSHPDLFKIDLDSGVREKVAGGSELHDSSWVVGQNGQIVARSEYEPRKGEWRLYRGPGAGDLVETVSDSTGEVSLESRGRTSSSVVVYGVDQDGDWVLFEYGQGAKKAVLFEGIATRDRLFDPVSGLLVGGVTNEDQPKTVLFDPERQARFDKVIRAFPGEIARLVSASASFDQMIIFTSGPTDSGTYFFVDYPSRKVVSVGWEYPTVLDGAVGATRVVNFNAADGLQLQGILTLPPGRQPRDLPIIVLPHGGPQSRDYLGFAWWASWRFSC